MITETLKHMGMIVVMGAIGLGTVTALLAYQGPAAKKGENMTNPAIGDRARDPQEKAGGPNRTQPTLAAKETPDNEEALERLDELRVNSEMKEIGLESLREDMRTIRLTLNRTEIELLGGISKEQRDGLCKAQAELRLHLQNLLLKYQDSLMKFARLKRQIDRESKAVGESSGFALAPTELKSRLSRLEEKLDRIIETMSAKGEL